MTTNARNYDRLKKAELVERLAVTDRQLDVMLEAIPELEARIQEQGWEALNLRRGETEFSRNGLRIIVHLCRLFYLKNPLVGRGVDLKTNYVFGQGVNIAGRHPLVNEVIQTFLDEPGNLVELTGQQAKIEREIDLEVGGNLFFVFFRNTSTGAVRLRSIPVDEVEEIYTNPADRREPWFYKRVWNEIPFDFEKGPAGPSTRTAYYPDFRFRPEQRPAKIAGVDVMWDHPIYHVKVGGLPDMRFGVPEIYAAIDWAKAYVDFLSAWSTIQQSLARFAWNLTTTGGKQGIATAKTRVGTTLNDGNTGRPETNPPPTAGSMFINAGNANLNPIKTAGATTTPDEARRLLLMVAAALGFPETFFGDVSVGTLATAKSLDRPTELMIRNRQMLWQTIISTILRYVVESSVRAMNGLLPGGVKVVDGVEVIDLGVDDDTQEAIDQTIDVTFPPILEHSITETVESIVKAATLGSQELKGTLPAPLVSRLLLQALGVEGIDEILEDLFPEGDPEQTAAKSAEVEERFRTLIGEIHDHLREARRARELEESKA